MDPQQPQFPVSQPPEKAAYSSLPRGVWVLGFGSLFMDASSELVHSLMPVFMVSVLGTSILTVGIIEGIAEATAAITKVFSGALSDHFRKRKFLIVLGYGLGAVTKPVFPLANAIQWVVAARIVDRIGKGIRGAPRDALIADLVPPATRGAAYGLRQALDSIGAFVGPLLAVAFMAWFANNIKAVLWVAVVPAFLAVILLVVAVREPETVARDSGERGRLSLANVKRLPIRYWLIVALGGVFNLARFSEAFLILRAKDVGLTLSLIPVIMIVMNVIYSLFAYPAGVMADRVHPRMLMVVGLGVLIAADGVLAAATSPLTAFTGAGLWGLHMALTQGLLSKLVANAAPEELRGTAFGLFNLISGIALLLASVIAGGLWSTYGPRTTFLAGAGFAMVAALGLLFSRPRTMKAPDSTGMS